MQQPIPFIGPSGGARSQNHDASRSVNLYLESAQVGAKGSHVMIGTPGLSLYRTIAESPQGADRSIRGMHQYTRVVGGATQDRLVIVASDQVHMIVIDPVNGNISVQLPGLIPGYGPISIADNGTSVLFATKSGRLYTWSGDANSAVTITPISPAIRATTVDFLDGYFLYVKAAEYANEAANVDAGRTGQFAISGLYSTTFDALDFATAEGSTDGLVALAVNHRDIWLFGTHTTEVWYNSGNPDFPFERNNGAVLEVGLAARSAFAKMDSAIYWLAQDKNGHCTVVRTNGYQPQRVSTHAIEYILSKFTDLSRFEAWAYAEEGHSFFVLASLDYDVTLVYDASTNEWHERGWRDDDNVLRKFRGRCHAFYNGTHFVGDWENTNVYTMSLDHYTDNGRPIQRIRRAGHISAGRRLFHRRLELDMETGVGLESGEEPQAMLSWSDDKGRTFKNQRWESFGKIGEYGKRVCFRRLGSDFDRVYELTITSSVKVAISQAYLHVT